MPPVVSSACSYNSPVMCSVVLPKTHAMSSVESQVDNSSMEEEQRGMKRKISLSNCGVCGSEEAKYRCPACRTHSCSLPCVKKHKDVSGCSGVRNKTAFVTLSQFDEMALLSDYRFLEDTGRFADSATRDNLIQAPRVTLKSKKLASNARKMNITLRFLPITFSKSRENSTFFFTNLQQVNRSAVNPLRAEAFRVFGHFVLSKVEKRFLWHLKLIFPQSSSEFTQRRVSDNQTLKQILTAYIHPTESDPVTRQKLKMYVQTPFDHVKVFMKVEGRKANSVRYHELDIQKSLRDNLSYKTLIEYPVLHVVLKDHWKDYPLKGPAEPASACTTIARKNEEVDQEKEAVTHVLPALQGSPTTAGSNIWRSTQETVSETEPPPQKKAKRGAEDEEQEEGEIIDSSDDEDGIADKNIPCDKSCNDAKDAANDTKAIKDEVQKKSVARSVDVINEHGDSSSDQ